MRILLVAWEYPPVIEGGLGRHVAHLSRALAGNGHEVHVLTRGTRAEEHVRGVQVHRVAVPEIAADLNAFLPWVDALNDQLVSRGEQLVSGADFDVIHSHDWLVADAARALAESAGAPWLVTVHATEFGRHDGWVHTHPQRQIHLRERAMVREAAHVICCSEYMAGHVRRVFGLTGGRVSTIANGVDERTSHSVPVPVGDAQRGALRRRHAGDAEALVLLAGRHVHEKGFHVALEAIAALGDPAVRFVVAGTGPSEADLRARAAKLGLAGRGAFLGRLADGPLQELYDVADVTVVPSLYEPFGIVPLEALSAGCPVIVSDVGGLREVVARCSAAVRVPAGDAGALAAALGAVLKGPRRSAAMAEAARQHALGFSWRSVAGQTEGIYAELRAATQVWRRTVESTI